MVGSNLNVATDKQEESQMDEKNLQSEYLQSV